MARTRSPGATSTSGETMHVDPGADVASLAVCVERLESGAVLKLELGGPDDDSLVGGAGNDTIFAGDNNDLLVGGGSDDQADFVGDLEEYLFTQTANGDIVVTHATGSRADGVDTTRQIEQYSFSNFDLSQDQVLSLVGQNPADYDSILN